MKLKIKCETPKEQVLVLRKFKELVPECNWASCVNHILDYIPFVDSNRWLVYLHIEGSDVFFREEYDNVSDSSFQFFTASDFLRDDWKPAPDNSELKAKFESIEKQLNELKELLDK